ncbi:hypothetical protein [Sphingomonas sp.]
MASILSRSAIIARQRWKLRLPASVHGMDDRRDGKEEMSFSNLLSIA